MEKYAEIREDLTPLQVQSGPLPPTKTVVVGSPVMTKTGGVAADKYDSDLTKVASDAVAARLSR